MIPFRRNEENLTCKHASRKEAAIIALFVALFLMLAWATRHQENPWGDEILTLEPAFNLAQGYGFHTYAYNTQDNMSFYAGNVPAFPLVAAAWLRLFGANLYSAHVLNYLLVAVSSLLIWWTCLRKDWIAAPAFRVALVITILCSIGIDYAAFNLRYDAWGMFLSSIAFFSFSLDRRKLRLTMLALVGAVMPFSGIHLLPASVIIGALLWVVFRRFPTDLLVLYAAGFLGVLGLVALYRYFHVWDSFLAIGHQEGRMPFFYKLQRLPKYLHYDPSLLLYLLAACTWALSAARRRILQWRSSLTLALLFAIALPLALFIFRWYEYSYSWICTTAMLLALASWISFHWREIHRPALIFGSALIVIGCAMGTPKTLLGKFADWHSRDYRNIEAWVTPYLDRQQLVLASPTAFFAVKEHEANVYFIQYFSMSSAREASKVTVMVIDPRSFSESARLLGGQWREIALYKSVGSGSWLSRFSRFKTEQAIYERVPGS